MVLPGGHQQDIVCCPIRCAGPHGKAAGPERQNLIVGGIVWCVRVEHDRGEQIAGGVVRECIFRDSVNVLVSVIGYQRQRVI